MAYSKANRLSRNPERPRTLWKCIIKHGIDKVNNTIIRSFNSESRCMILHSTQLTCYCQKFKLCLQRKFIIECNNKSSQSGRDCLCLVKASTKSGLQFTRIRLFYQLLSSACAERRTCYSCHSTRA